MPTTINGFPIPVENGQDNYLPTAQAIAKLDQTLYGIKAVSVSSANYTIVASDLQYACINATGAATSRNVTFPTGATKTWVRAIKNSGTSSVTFKTSASGTPRTVTLVAGAATIAICDGTNIDDLTGTASSGDMLASVYDPNGDGKVTSAVTADTASAVDAANVTGLAEAVQDIVGAMVVNGSNVTATYNDTTGQLTISSTGGGSAPTITDSLNYVITDGGSVISTGSKGCFEVGFTGTIVGVRLFSETSGSIVVDLQKDTYANFPPTSGDSICAAAKPTLSSAQKSQDTTLTGWTTSVTAGDVIRVVVDSASTVTQVTVALRIQRS